MDNGFSQEPPGVWVMLERHGGPQVPVGHRGVPSLSLQECSHLSLRETSHWQQRFTRQEIWQKNQHIIKFRPTLKKKFLPTFYILIFFSLFLLSRSSASKSTHYFHLRDPRGGKGQNRVAGGGCVLVLAPGTQEGLVAEPSYLGGPSGARWHLPPPEHPRRHRHGGDPAGHCVVAAAGLT